MSFWSVKNVQKYYNYKSVFMNCQEILCRAALEVIQVHCLNYILSAIEALICHTDIEVNIGSTFFGFAQNSLHDFQNMVYDLIVALSSTMPQKVF